MIFSGTLLIAYTKAIWWKLYACVLEPFLGIGWTRAFLQPSGTRFRELKKLEDYSIHSITIISTNEKNGFTQNMEKKSVRNTFAKTTNNWYRRIV